MTEQEQRSLTAILNAIAVEQAGAHHYQEKQMQARSGRGGYDLARPLEFDGSGFRKESSGMIQRVARLLNPL